LRAAQLLLLRSFLLSGRLLRGYVLHRLILPSHQISSGSLERPIVSQL
jgi:hypothetical protein